MVDEGGLFVIALYTRWVAGDVCILIAFADALKIEMIGFCAKVARSSVNLL